jgi:type VI secretion system protein ImpA
VDLTESGKLQELERLAVPAFATTTDGKRIADDDTRREPNWGKIETDSLALLKESHDLRVAGFHAAARLRTAGLPGLAEGLQLMEQMLETWGVQAHPTVDTTNPQSVMERLLALASIAAPYKRDGDLLRVVEGVRKTPLTETSTREFNHAYLLSGRKKDGSQDPTITEAFKQSWAREPEARKHVTLDAIDASLASLAGITAWIQLNLPDNMVSSDPTMSSVAPLVAELQDIKRAIALTVEDAQKDTPADEAVTDTESQLPSEPDINTPSPETGMPAVASATAPSGIRNRADAIRALKQAMDYFKTNEPTSPSIYYIERACNLAGKNFRDVLVELIPEAATKFEELLGIKEQK